MISRTGTSVVFDLTGLLLQVCGWTVVVVAILAPVLGLSLLLTPAAWAVMDLQIMLVLFALPWVCVPLSIALVHGGGQARRRGRPQGLCRRCGYDLRVGHDRCPECGTER